MRKLSDSCTDPYDSCTASGKPWQHDGVCLEDKCKAPDSLSMEFAIEVRYRSMIYKTVASLYIRGTGAGLSWERPIKMSQSAVAIDLWKTKLQYTMDSDGMQCLKPNHCSQNQLFVEFRIYRDEEGREDMLGPNFFYPLPISRSLQGSASFLTPEITFFPWFFSKTITTKQYSYESNYLLGKNLEPLQVKYTVLFPPSFNDNLKKLYPLVLLISSGSQIFPVLEHLYVYEASVEEAVVVVVHFSLSDLELVPFHHTYEPTCKTDSCHDCQTCWGPTLSKPCTREKFVREAFKCLKMTKHLGRADDAIKSILHELLPAVRQHTKKRAAVHYPSKRMTIIGFGDNSLLALYAAISYPHAFSNVACISPKFFLPLDSSFNAHSGTIALIKEEGAKLQMGYERQFLYATQKYYFDNGELDNYFFPIADALEATDAVVEELMMQFKLKENANIMRMIIPRAKLGYEQGSEPDINSRIRLPLAFFFRSAGSPNKDFIHTLGTPLEQAQVEDDAQNQISTEATIPHPPNDTVILETLLNQTESESGCPSYRISLKIFLGSVGWFCMT